VPALRGVAIRERDRVLLLETATEFEPIVIGVIDGFEPCETPRRAGPSVELKVDDLRAGAEGGALGAASFSASKRGRPPCWAACLAPLKMRAQARDHTARLVAAASSKRFAPVWRRSNESNEHEEQWRVFNLGDQTVRLPLMSKTTRLSARKSADPNTRRTSSGPFQFA
jgi:hypothetical protein